MSIIGKSETPLISVVVPVYNVEKYLERCVNSLINQTYSNIEIILVDDGSTDSSGILCDEIKTADHRIIVIHKNNGGLSSARNVGIKNSTGEFITFIDSDDWVALDTYEYSVNLMKQFSADSVQYDYIMVSDEKPIKQRKEVVKCYEGKSILQYYMESTTRTGSYSVCRCVFPREVLAKLTFREGKINEDIDFKYKALSCCEKLVVSNQYKYFYFQSGNSLSLGGLKRRDFDLYEAADELVKMTKMETFGSISFLGNVKQARTSLSLLSKIAYCGIDDDKLVKGKLVKELQSELRKNVTTLLKGPIPLSRKILTILFSISYSFTEQLIHLLRK